MNFNTQPKGEAVDRSLRGKGFLCGVWVCVLVSFILLLGAVSVFAQSTDQSAAAAVSEPTPDEAEDMPAVLDEMDDLEDDAGLSLTDEPLGTTSDALPAVPAAPVEPPKPKDIFKLQIPASWGKVKEVYKGNPDKIIIHIQDAHCNYECQSNIGNILDQLVAEYGLTIAGIEGSSGKLLTDILATFPEDSIRQQLADESMRSGSFNGAEALVIAKGAEYPLQLYGIEDKALYNDNFNAFKASLPFKNEVKGFFLQLSHCLDEIKNKVYDDKLMDFEAKLQAFEKKETEVNEYAQYLSETLTALGMNMGDYPNVASLFKAVTREKEIDFAKAEEERTAVLSEITNVLSEEDMQALMEQGAQYRNELITAADYLFFIKELAAKNKIDFTPYKNLDAYIEYSRAYDQIASATLFDEIDDIETLIRSRLHTNDDQRELDTLRKGLSVMERMVDIKMVNKDLAYFRKHQEDLKTARYLKFIDSQKARLSLDLAVPADIGYLDVYIPAWADFYEKAGLRDKAMIANSLKLMTDHTQKLVAMITGGFHTRVLTEMLREQNVSFVVITPRITTNDGNRYFDILEGKKTEMEKFAEEVVKAFQQEAATPEAGK